MPGPGGTASGLPTGSLFAGLLPEGRRLGALRRAVKTSADDDLTLLLAVYERRTLRMPPTHAVRIAMGFAMPVMLIGHVVATRPGTDPDAAPVMIGSHIDTVRTGGWFDGNLGVLGGLEVVETLAQHDIATKRPISVAFFTDEEGARFQPDMLGSLVYVGGLPLEEALTTVGVDGAVLGDARARQQR